MATEVLVAIITAVSPVAVAIFAIISNNRIIAVKIDALEKKQDKHNGLIERMAVVEQSNKSAHYRIDSLVNNRGVKQ